MAGLPEEKRRFSITPEPAIQAGSFSLDYRAIWLALLAGVSALTLVVSIVANVTVWGLVLIVLYVIAFFVFVGVPMFDNFSTSLLALLFRRGEQQLATTTGRNKHLSEEPRHGQAFDITTDTVVLTKTTERIGQAAGRKHPPAPIKRIGRVDFYPYKTGKVGQPPLGVARDRRYGTYSATMWAAGSSLLSADARAEQSQLEGFAQLLDSMALTSSPVHRFVWREQTLLGEPQHPAAIRATLQEGAGLRQKDLPHDEVVDRRIRGMSRDSIVHRTTMTLSLYQPSIRKQIKQVGSVEGVLGQQLNSFHKAAMGTDSASPIGLRDSRFLSHNQLVVENRLALDPVFMQPLWENWTRLDDTEQELDPYDAWPQFVDLEPDDYCRFGQTFHMGYYVSGFSPGGMGSDQFWELLKVPVPKIVTTVFQMVPLQQARRRAKWTTNSVVGANSDRQLASRRVTEFQGYAAEEAIRHEREIARTGRQVGRMRSYIDVTGASVQEVTANALAVRNASYDAEFHLEPLVSRQIYGVEAAMPIGRGLAAIPLKNWY